MKPYFESANITIYHGDCREILPSLPKARLVLTDPPYAIGAGRGEWAATAAVAIGLHEAAKRVTDDGALLAFSTSSGRGIQYTLGVLGSGAQSEFMPRRVARHNMDDQHARGINDGIAG
jgi:DNA modification methylase